MSLFLDVFEWIQYGVAQGYCSETFCNTHDGTPLSDEEADAYEDGDDPCVHAVRLYAPDQVPA